MNVCASPPSCVPCRSSHTEPRMSGLEAGEKPKQHACFHTQRNRGQGTQDLGQCHTAVRGSPEPSIYGSGPDSNLLSGHDAGSISIPGRDLLCIRGPTMWAARAGALLVTCSHLHAAPVVQGFVPSIQLLKCQDHETYDAATGPRERWSLPCRATPSSKGKDTKHL